MGNRDKRSATNPERRYCSISEYVLVPPRDASSLTDWIDIDISFGWDPSSGGPPNFTASPYAKPTAEICYRTMPQDAQDGRLQPDLRLGESDASVRKVAALVAWFKGLAGL